MKSLKRNDAFFVPTIMMYIVIFLFIIIFLVIQSFSLEVNIKGYESNMYREVSYLDSQKLINDYIDDMGDNYAKTCRDDSLEKKTKYYDIEISLKCRRFIDFEKINLDELRNETIKLEYTDEEYEKIQKKSNTFDRDHMTVDKMIYRITEILFPEEIKEVEEVKKELKKILEDQVVFDVNITVGNRNYKYMQFYEFEKNKTGLRIHT